MLKGGPSVLAMLCGMMVAASAASTHMTPGSSISSLSNAAVAAVVVGTVAVFLARGLEAIARTVHCFFSDFANSSRLFFSDFAKY